MRMICLLGAVAALTTILIGNPSGANAQTVWIRDVTIVSPDQPAPMPGMHVLLADGVIQEISETPSDAAHAANEVIAGDSLFLTPGLIDSHVHLRNVPGMLDSHAKAHPDLDRIGRAQIPRSYLYYGFTTLIDLVGAADYIGAWNALEIRPDVHWCGGAPVANGYPTAFFPPELRFRILPYSLWDAGQGAELPEGIDPAEQTPAAVVARMKADGAICVKTFYEPGFGGRRDWPTPPLELVQELVKTAHAEGLPVLIHANSQEAQGFALKAGADIIVHGMWHWNDNSRKEQSPEVTALLDEIAKRGIGYHPTMQVIYGEHDLFDDAFLDDPEFAKAVPADLIAWYKTDEGKWFRDQLAGPHGMPEDPSLVNAAPIARLKQTVATLIDRDAHFLFGTDTPSAPIYANPHGLNGLLELRALAGAGIDPARLFRAATLDNARAFGLDEEIGTVTAGKKANLLLMREDPTKAVSAYDTIETVIQNGKVLDREALSALAVN